VNLPLTQGQRNIPVRLHHPEPLRDAPHLDYRNRGCACGPAIGAGGRRRRGRGGPGFRQSSPSSARFTRRPHCPFPNHVTDHRSSPVNNAPIRKLRSSRDHSGPPGGCVYSP
jgi:hypothetical protein